MVLDVPPASMWRAMAKKLKTTSPMWSHDRGHGLRDAFGESVEGSDVATKSATSTPSAAPNADTPPPSRPNVGDIAPW